MSAEQKIAILTNERRGGASVFPDGTRKWIMYEGTKSIIPIYFTDKTYSMLCEITDLMKGVAIISIDGNNIGTIDVSTFSSSINQNES